MWQRLSIPVVGRHGEIGSGSNDARSIRFYAPRYGLSRDRPERMGRKRQRVTRIGLCEPYHFADFDDDLGERKSALLLRRYPRPYGSAKRIDERKEPFVVPGNEIIGRPIT